MKSSRQVSQPWKNQNRVFPNPGKITVMLALLSSAQAVTLDECIRTTLEANPDAQAAEARIAAAHEAVRQATSAYFPTVTLSSTIARTDNAPQAFFMQLNQRVASMQSDFNHPGDVDNWRNSVGAKARLLDAGQRGYQRDAAKLGAQAEAASKRALDNELVHQVTRAFYSVLQAQAFVQVRQESVASLTESLRVANERLRAGSAAKSDVLNIEVRLAEAREDLIRAQHGVQLTLAALNMAIGRDLVSETALPEAMRQAVASPVIEPNLDAVEARPELEAARLAAQAQEKMQRKTERENWPTLSAFGSADWDSEVNSDFQRSYFVGAVAEWDIFTGFRQSGASAEAKARTAAAKAAAQKALNSLRLDLKQAQLETREAGERLDVTQRSVASAEEALRITNERYRQGAADVTELLTAQVGLTATRSRSTAAYYDLLVAQSNLKRARGELVK
ncbi:MAG: TolC family protein [Verrucomicrobia bacterium]|nr:MAG: TolC family protein [Verrucomicrobiota bacterium]